MKTTEVLASELAAGDVVVFTRELVPDDTYMRERVIRSVARYWRNPLSQPGTNMFVTGHVAIFWEDDGFDYGCSPEHPFDVRQS